MDTALVLDTETTGIDEPQVVQFAWKLIEFGGATVKEYDEYFKPTVPMTLGALATHHIIPELLENAHDQKELEVPPVPYFIAHNIDFDMKALGEPEGKRICTLALSRRYWPNLDSHTLGALFYHLEGATRLSKSILVNAHSASADVGILCTVLKHIIARTGATSFETLWHLSEEARIPLKMGFGKYKGQTIESVPREYAMWYARQESPDPYYIQAFKQAGKIR